MASGQSSNDPSRPAADRDADVRASRIERQQLLDEVLQATLEMSRSEEPLRPEEMRALLAVAKRRKSEPFTVETATELVETVLRVRFRRVVESSGLWDRMTREIATTVFDDPRAREGLQRFWDRLCEAAP